MVIQSVRVDNFRSLREFAVTFESLTALVGPNGCGKSALLRALELFYSPTPKIAEDDYYGRDTSAAIIVAVTFSGLSAAASAQFAKYVENGTLTVERVFEWQGSKAVATYHGASLGNPDFAPVHAATTASEKKVAYNLLRADERYSGLPAWRTQAEGLAALDEWEQNNPQGLVRVRDSGQFFGFTQVAQGYLGAYTRLLFIPAVRDASKDAEEGRGSVLTDLMDLVVRSAIAGKAEVASLKSATQQQYEQIMSPNQHTELTSLEARLTTTLGHFAPGAAVALKWQPLRPIEIPMPAADVRLVEDGFEAMVERSGHGLQRAFIMTMLQLLSAAQVPPAGNVSEAAGSTGPHVVLAIEEPELYQHPSRQRHLAGVLAKLASCGIAGVVGRAQVVYATHSPFFVGLDRFESVRLMRKERSTTAGPKASAVRSATLDAIANKVWDADGQPGSPYTGATLRPRLTTIMTPWMSEGFFAEVVVLVEGESDRAAVAAAADALGVDLEASGVAIIPCFGKSNIDRPAIIFDALGISTYLVWDNDQGEDGAKPEENHRLLRVVGAPVEDWPTGEGPRHACMAPKLEDVLKGELGASEFERHLDAAKAAFAIRKNRDALKNPLVVRAVFDACRANGLSCARLETIVRGIEAVRASRT